VYAQKERLYGESVMRLAERNMLLRFWDQVWKDHLHALDHLRQGVHLRSYAQKDPLNEYKREAFELFEMMLALVSEKITEFLFHFETQPESAQSLLDAFLDDDDAFEHISYNRDEDDSDPFPEGMGISLVSGPKSSQALPEGMVAPSSRNALCPCGSGERFKNCHGKL